MVVFVLDRLKHFPGCVQLFGTCVCVFECVVVVVVSRGIFTTVCFLFSAYPGPPQDAGATVLISDPSPAL